MQRIHYRWVRLAVLTAMISACLLSGAWIYVYAGGGSEPAAASPVEQVVDVGRGDTLWGIAKDHLPKGESISSYIYKIKQRNGLQQSNLREGQLLVLP